jgi:hypothetical protein
MDSVLPVEPLSEVSARVHSTRSPDTIGPTPAGVPVKITSPAYKYMVNNIHGIVAQNRTYFKSHNGRDMFDEARDTENHVLGIAILRNGHFPFSLLFDLPVFHLSPIIIRLL